MKYSIAFEEVYEIFKLMPKELLNKIPIEFQKIIEEERDKNYFANIVARESYLMMMSLVQSTKEQFTKQQR